MNHLVDQYFDSLSDKKVAVLGIGVSNRPLIRMLLAHGLHVLACDKTPREKLEEDLTVSEVPGDVTKLARYCVETVLPDMAALRCVADEMESIAPTDRWPYPSYGELLFGVR